MLNTAYVIINFLSYILPIRLAYFITKWIVVVAYFTVYGKAKKNVEKNIEFVFGDKLKEWEKKKILRETFLNFGLFIYEFLIIRKINKRSFRKFLNPVGFEKVEKALRKGRGVLIVTAHVGNWEWGAVMLTYLGYPPTVIAKRFKNEFLTRFYFKKRSMHSLEVVYLDDAVKKSLRKLRTNGLVAILGDRDYTSQGIEVPFLGKPVRLPTGAVLLSKRSGAVVIPAFAIRVGTCKYNVFFEDPIEYSKEGYKEEDIKKDIMRLSKVIEKYIKKYPSQWYNFGAI
ncbi:MAG: hypothetical protein B5M53_06845 [Candidatus Cloacimonas sp. 4484_209]|nr:MAG: hypothetical protein B5M53_06845 [Candidatus Cloacimonas sp. 4484_209]